MSAEEAKAAPLRVLHLLRTLHPESGGPLSWLEATVSASRGLPLTHALACFGPSGSAPAGVAEAYRALRFSDFALGNGVGRWLLRHAAEFDVAHVHGVFSFPLLVGGAACRARGLPYVISTHGHLYDWSLRQRRLGKAAYLRSIGGMLLRRAAGLMSTTDAESAVLQRRLPGARILQVAPCLPDTAPPPQRAAEGGLRLVFVGRLAPQKGVPVLFEALALLRARGVAARLDMVGSGDAAYVAAMRAQCTALELDGAVAFRGFLEGAAKAAALAAANVFVLPSNMENFSFATAEALATGLPAVVSSEVGLAPTIARYECGAVVPPADAAALATALQRLADPAPRAVAARRALDCTAAEFSRARMGAALLHAYRVAVRA